MVIGAPGTVVGGATGEAALDALDGDGGLEIPEPAKLNWRAAVKEESA